MNNAGRIGFVIKGDYDDSAKYDFLDVVFYNSASYVAKKVTIGNSPEKNNEYWQILAEGGTLTEEGNISNTSVEFEQEENRVNVSSGEKISKIIGKVKKFFDDLKPVAFSGKYADIADRITLTNSLMANQSGTALDAVQGKVLDDKISAQNADFANSLAQINSDLIRIKFIDAAAVAQSNSNLLVGTTFATIIPNYSQINGTILGSCLIALGKDDYEQGVLSTTIALGSITREGNKISKIGAFSSVVQTIRARIAVFYTE